MKNFSKNAILLLSCILINGITSIFIYTYLLAFILDVSSNGIVNVAIFYLVMHVTMIILSWVMAPLFKKFNKSLALKLGIIFKFLFVVIVVYLGESIINYVYIISIFNAFSEVMYWGGANPLQPVVTKKGTLALFMSISKIVASVIGLIVPIIMGFFIDKIGMASISIAMVIIVIVQLILAIFINETNEIDNRELKYKDFWSKIKTGYPQAKTIYWNQFLSGFCSNIATIILYYTLVTFGNNVSIGIFSTIASILSMIILALYNINKKAWSNYISSAISSLLLGASIIFVMIELNKVSLTMFYFLYNITMTIPGIITGASRFSIIKQNALETYNVENVTISETYLDAGRVVGEVLLLSMGLINNRIFDIFSLCIAIISILVYYIHITNIDKKYMKVN